MSSRTSTPTTHTTTAAAVIDAFGAPELLHPADIPVPPVTDSQVQLEVAAVAINPVDLSTRAGVNIPVADARFPMVLGWDVAGTVVATGPQVDAWRVGDRVAAMVFQPSDQQGTYARYLNLDASVLARVPDSLSLEQAATIPLAGLTAAQLLDAVKLETVKTLLINGPLGAVGRITVALAVRAGAEVIGVTRPNQAADLLKLGAAFTVDRGEFTSAVRQRYPNGVDAAIDLVGGRAARAAFDSIRDAGRYQTSVPPYIDATGQFDSKRQIPVDVLVVHADSQQLTTLLNLAADGALPTTVETTYPLDQAADAHRRQAAGQLTGRVLLTP